MTPTCQYCHVKANKVTGEEIYPHREDLHHKVFFKCPLCDSYVGTHEATGKPLGTLANAELRKLRSEVHALIDPVWQIGGKKRSEVYTSLSKFLMVRKHMCHVAMFNADTCRKILKEFKP